MTTNDLQAYSSVLERLKPLINTELFDEEFRLLTGDLAKSQQFLIKMELKRLAQPCSYYIDLRGRVDGDVRPFEHKGQTHYLDEVAIQTFEKGLKQYGQYTIGIFEDVTNTNNNFRVRHQQETNKRLQDVLSGEVSDTRDLAAIPSDIDATANDYKAAHLIRFAGYSVRREERMNFSIDIEVVLQDEERFPATTSDLSVSGCKIKIPLAIEMTAGQKVAIFFRGLEQEFALGINNGIPYQVIDSEPVDKSFYVRLKRLPLADEKGFSEFLHHFIHGNKRRYKVNLDNTYDAVFIKGYEQFYLPRISSLPVFLAVNEGKATPACVLTTENNRHLMHYFQDERQQNVLPQLLHVRRLKQCLAKEAQENSTVLYTFTHAAKGRLFFYSATTEELLQYPELKSVFFGFGAAKPSFRALRMSVLRTVPAHAHIPLSLPNSADQEVQKLNQPPTPLISNFIRNLRYIVALTDISTAQSSSLYKAMTYDAALLNQLKVFGHAKLEQSTPIESASVQYVNLRSESRFLYKTTVVLEQAKGGDIQSFSRDFSSKGLQLECAEPVSFSKGDTVKISLPELQKITTKHQLSGLPYEVMAVSKNKLIMNMRVIDPTNDHAGKIFFQQLINNNRSKLTMAEETPKFPGLGPALRNMYVKALDTFAFYVHRQGVRYNLDIVAMGAKPSALHKLLTQFSEGAEDITMLPLLKNNATNLQFANQLKKMKRQEVPFSYEVFLRFTPDQNSIEQSFETKFDFDFQQHSAKKDFVDDVVSTDLLFAFKIFLSRTGRPDTEHIAKELGYVSTYAIHKAKVLEEELWSVVGVGDVVDITDEVLLRYNIGNEQIVAQQQKRLALLAGIKLSE
ncbi:MAG: PilZ domain-containing protein [Gammaproteobacteria bacterium]|nr:PilZ domain-containing protein [Gammaproteobacteria bacterium]